MTRIPAEDEAVTAPSSPLDNALAPQALTPTPAPAPRGPLARAKRPTKRTPAGGRAKAKRA